MEAIPLHLAASNITAHEVTPIAQEHSVSHCVDVRGCEVSNARVAGVLAVGGVPLTHQLLPHLHDNRVNMAMMMAIIT